MSMTVLARVSLFFAGRLTAAARKSGANLVVSRGVVPLAVEAERVRPSLVVCELEKIDLQQIQALKSRPGLRGIRVVGFASHKLEALSTSAREAGCDEVLPKSQLASRLEELFGEG